MTKNRSSAPGARMPSRTRRGFTLIEVMVAIAVLAICFTSIFNVQASSIEAASRTKYITAATLLAHSKMIDIEQKLKEEGFSDFSEEEEGTFDEEGWPDFRWRASILKVRIPMPSSLPEESDSSSDTGTNAYASMMTGYASFITDLISNALREVNVVVEWGDGGEGERVSLSTHFVETSRANALEAATGGAASSSSSSSSSSSGSSSGKKSSTTVVQ